MTQEKTGESPQNKAFEESKASASVGKDFSRMISLKRSLRWPSAKKFWTEKKEELACSYNRYAVIEKGSARAGLDLAKRIIRALDIAGDSGLFAWVRDMMPDDQSRACFVDPAACENFARTPLLYLDRDRVRLFRDQEFAFEMAGYISMYTFRGVSEDELCKAFGLSKALVKDLINQLMLCGVVVKNPKDLYEVPDEAFAYLSDLPELKELRVKAFNRVVESHYSKPFVEGHTVEMAYMRLFSPEQMEKLRARVKSLASWVEMLPDEAESEPYYIGIAANPATFGRSRKKLFHADRDIETL